MQLDLTPEMCEETKAIVVCVMPAWAVLAPGTGALACIRPTTQRPKPKGFQEQIEEPEVASLRGCAEP